MKYLIYCRKSTEDKNKQLQSIEDQKRILEKLAVDRNLEVLEIITDEKSAKKPGRIGFNRMIKLLELGKAQGIICWKADRLARNPIDGGLISFYLQTNIINEIVTPEKTHYPNDNTLLLAVEFGIANQFILDLGKNVKRGMQSKVEKGWKPCKAPAGYLNEKSNIVGSNKIFKDPVRFPIVKKMWDLLLTGNYSVPEVKKIAEEEYGLRNKKGEKFSYSSIHKIFHNPFYFGKFWYKGELYQGSHEAMIKQEEFDKVQEIINKRSPYTLDTNYFTYKGIFTCQNCGGMIGGSRKHKTLKESKKRVFYDYYRCSRQKKGKECTEKPLSEVRIEEQIDTIINKFDFPKEFYEFGIDLIKETDFENELKSNKSEKLSKASSIESLYAHHNTIEKELDSIMNKIIKIEDTDVLNELQRILKVKKTEKLLLESKIKEMEEKQKNFKENLIKNISFLKNLKSNYKSINKFSKKELLSNLGANWGIEDKKVYFKAKKEFEPFLNLKNSTKGISTGGELTKPRINITKNTPKGALFSTWWS